MPFALIGKVLNLTKDAVGLGVHLVSRVLGSDRPEPAAAPPRRPEPRPEPSPAPPRPAADRPEPAPTPAPAPPPEPDRLVASFADPGAQEGPGAEVHVDEPWPGYGRMKANEVTSRIANADAATLAAVKLYESSHRNRKSVLAATDRLLKTA